VKKQKYFSNINNEIFSDSLGKLSLWEVKEHSGQLLGSRIPFNMGPILYFGDKDPLHLVSNGEESVALKSRAL
jgi:hypothetical protein